MTRLMRHLMIFAASGFMLNNSGLNQSNLRIFDFLLSKIQRDPYCIAFAENG